MSGCPLWKFETFVSAGKEDEQPSLVTGWAGLGHEGWLSLIELLHHLSALAHHTTFLCFCAPRALLDLFHCERAAQKDRGQRLGLQERRKDMQIWELRTCP